MRNTAENRQIVQKGLDRRAAARRDAALEAQARKLRIIINDNHLAKTTPMPFEIHKVEPKKATSTERRRNEERADRSAEAAYCAGWYSCLAKTFTPIVIAAATIGLSEGGMLPMQLTYPIAIACFLVGLGHFAEWFLFAERS